jgi:hypothetical protein
MPIKPKPPQDLVATLRTLELDVLRQVQVWAKAQDFAKVDASSAGLIKVVEAYRAHPLAVNLSMKTS